MPLGSKKSKARATWGLERSFRTYSLGVVHQPRCVVYDFDAEHLAKEVEQFIENYNAEVDRWRKKASRRRTEAVGQDIDNFVSNETGEMEPSDLNESLLAGRA